MELAGFCDASAFLQSGVYALVHRGQVVYIGKAKAMITRVATHRSNARRKTPSWLPDSAKGIVFDEVHIQPCHPDRIDELEYAMINLYKPRCNILLKHNGKSSAPFQLNIGGVALMLNRPPAPTLRVERRV